MVDVAIVAAKALFAVLLVLQVMGMGVFFERKVSALIQDRIGANRASIFGVAALGLINTLVADPVKFLVKEDIIPARSDRLLHFLAPILAVMPVLVTFAVVRTLGFGVREYAMVNIAIVVLWLVIAAMLAKENRKLSDTHALAA